jgi:hypothetical protein
LLGVGRGVRSIRGIELGEDPREVIGELYSGLGKPDERDRMFALAELSFAEAEANNDQPFYLATAVFAYSFLFPDNPKDTPDPYDPRLTILGHAQRGARPGAFDRLLATRLAARATEMLLRDDAGYLIGFHNGAATPNPLANVIGQSKPLPAEFLALADTMQL